VVSLRLMTLCVLAGSGCAGLPPPHKPVDLAQEAPVAALEGAATASWPAQEWWTRYQDPTLDRLIEMAVGTAPTLASAQSRLNSARESVRLAGAATGVHVDLNGDFDRQRLSDNGLISPALLGFSWYDQADLGLAAAYSFDWWHKQRDAVEAAVDQALAAQADRSASALVLASSIADAYFGWQADMARIGLQQQRLAAVQGQAKIAASRVRQELDAADTLHHNDADIAAIREQVAGLQGSAKLRAVVIASLVGRSEADLPAFEAKPLPAIPTGLPDSVRLDLIARRADIIASRWRVESAQKSLESARAEFYPDITINALAGLSSLQVSKLLEIGSGVPQVGAAIHLPLFDSGRLRARYRGTEAMLGAAVAAYQQTLVDAAREVATQAATRAQLAAQRQQRLIEIDAALRLHASAAARVRQGTTDLRAELAATESWLTERDALLQLDAAALSADIGLQRALGGGYTTSLNAAP
jgi:multidrug efflux system outer membrane protein